MVFCNYGYFKKRSQLCWPNDWGKTLKSQVTKTTISFSIAPTFLMVPARSFGGFSTLKLMGRQDLYFLRLKAEEIGVFIAGVFFGLESKRAIAPKAASTHLMDPWRKIEDGFGFCNNGLLDGLVPNILPTALLLGLGTDKRP